MLTKVCPFTLVRRPATMRCLARVALSALATLFGAALSDAAPGADHGAATLRRDASMRISAAGGHTCQVKEDGSVRCWGLNDSGQLGNGNTTDQPVPVPVSGLTSVIAVAAGGDLDFDGGFTCAVQVTGTARCWGANGNGQLGDGTRTAHRLTSVAVSGITDAVAITAGGAHTCSLHATGRVRCWGENGDGQLGDGTTVDRLTPVIVSGLTNAVAVDAGETHTCALLADGTARCWGSNSLGELGDGTSGNRRLTAVVVSGLSRGSSISAGYHHSCALTGGTARCWGWNRFGALGDGNVDVIATTPVITRNLNDAVTIAAGWLTTCASLADGTARCWGPDGAGQLGNGIADLSDHPVPVTVSGLSVAVAITTGGVHTCAMLAEGSAACWGGNGTSQLGTGTSASFSPFPSVVKGGGGGFSARAVAAGRNHTCAVRANGTVACWGDNTFGQIGDGSFGVDRLIPVAVPGLTNAVAIAAGDSHTCALLVVGTVRCWGLNSSGQLGNGTLSTKTTPVTVLNLTNVAAITAGGGIGGSHTCALLANGSTRCWGANANGQLGDNTTTARSSPVAVLGQTFIVAISAGELHTCAAVATGTSRCWGSNTHGQLGDGTLADHFRPEPISGLTDAVALAAGNLHTCALLANGGTRCWGENLLGQLGNGTNTSNSLPGPVIGLSANLGVAIAGGFGHTCAVIVGGGARCWGDNSQGQLGNATTTSATAPVVVESVRTVFIIGGGNTVFRQPLSNAVSIAAGRRHSCALIATGGVSCWGENSSGELGIGTTNRSLSPAAVPSFTLNIDTTVLLEHNELVATVTIVANCEVGQTLHFEVGLAQGDAEGTGHGSGKCTGELERYPLTVTLHGTRFVEAPARVSAVAVIRDGPAVQTQEWARQVSIVRER